MRHCRCTPSRLLTPNYTTNLRDPRRRPPARMARIADAARDKGAGHVAVPASAERRQGAPQRRCARASRGTSIWMGKDGHQPLAGAQRQGKRAGRPTPVCIGHTGHEETALNIRLRKRCRADRVPCPGDRFPRAARLRADFAYLLIDRLISWPAGLADWPLDRLAAASPGARKTCVVGRIERSRLQLLRGAWLGRRGRHPRRRGRVDRSPGGRACRTGGVDPFSWRAGLQARRKASAFRSSGSISRRTGSAPRRTGSAAWRTGSALGGLHRRSEDLTRWAEDWIGGAARLSGLGATPTARWGTTPRRSPVGPLRLTACRAPDCPATACSTSRMAARCAARWRSRWRR